MQQTLFPPRRTSAKLRQIAIVEDSRRGYRPTVLLERDTPAAKPSRPAALDPPRRAVRPPKLDNLVLSNPRRTERSRYTQTAGSVLLHAAIVYAAVVATARADSTGNILTTDTNLVYLTTEPNKPEPEPEPPKVEQQVMAAIAPPKGFQAVVAPMDVPVDIPPIDVGERFDPRDYSGIGTQGGVFSGVEGGAASIEPGQVFEPAVVEEIPERLSGPALQYPVDLRRLGVEGSVVVEFIVDTTGTVEPESFRIVSSTHEGFEWPARDAILNSRFRAGRLRGRPVRVLVQQRLDFSLITRRG